MPFTPLPVMSTSLSYIMNFFYLGPQGNPFAMAEPTLGGMSTALSSQTLSLGEASANQPTQGGDLLAHAPPPPPGPGDANPNPETPVKRRPGRPKGSGKKSVDLSPQNQKPKRPVGRPRKDGLPPGTVTEKKQRPRKRPPGSFATVPGVNGQAPGLMPFGLPPFADPTQWHASLSVPPIPTLATRPPVPPPMPFPIDPNLDRDNWADLALSSAGPTVEDAFRAHLQSLVPDKDTHIPMLYSVLKAFWLPSSPPYFSLTSSAGSSARIPSEHRFFYWDPQLLIFNGIFCPACNAPLINKGKISTGPIKVYDLGKPFYIIGCEYVCRSQACAALNNGEGRKYASTDHSILSVLPLKLRDEFPARLIVKSGAMPPDFGTGIDVWQWRDMGISLGLWNMVRQCLRTGLQKDAIIGILNAITLGVPDEWPMPPPPLPPAAVKKADTSLDADADADGRAEGEEEEEEEEPELNGNVNKEATGQHEFQEAWNANSASGGPSGPPEAGPSDPSAGGAPALSPPVPVPGPPPPEYVQGFSQHPYLPYGYPPYGYYPGPPPPAAQSASMKRQFALVDGQEEPISGPVHKRVRHCVKCGSSECKGKGGRAFCQNQCQDCGKFDCKGRNSKKPDRTCADAWP
ncbi:hypothetical protein EIP86_007183 [Pleurotus ostreatoroseus]|nr:hypothetical protein EIP86_007183 [Pleurotus ostreatoroseus]